MTDGTFVEALVHELNKPHSVEIDGKTEIIAPRGWERIDRRPFPKPQPLTLATLTGVRDYITKNVDEHDPRDLMLHVSDHASVSLIESLDSEDEGFRRKVYLAAQAPAVDFKLGQYHDAESFVIGLQTCFVPTPEREEVLLLIASIRESAVRETVDDGVSQEVKTARGIAVVDRTKVPNPVVLRPYRTFREVEQPASAFVLRMQSGPEGGKPKVALFEADGGTWRLEAIQAIAAWLGAHASDVAVIA